MTEAGGRTSRGAHPPVVGRSALVAALVAVGLLGGCAPGPLAPRLPPPPGSVPRVVPAPSGCDQTLVDPVGAQRALDQASPGQRLCLVGVGLRGTQLRLARSGTRDRPIQLESDGATLAGLDVQADHIVVEGFNTLDGDGIAASGTDITINNNDVRGAGGAGIRCWPCANSLVGGNTVVDANGSGILVGGRNVTARDNDVTGPGRRRATEATEATEAAGLSFAGGVVLLHNTVRRAVHVGDPGAEPRVACLQTAGASAGTVDASVFSGAAATATRNTCVDVEGPCLRADATQRPGGGPPAGLAALRFLGNYCQTGADRAVSLIAYPGVVVRGNTFSSSYTAGVVALRGSTGLTVADNIVVGTFPPAQVDDASRPGLRESDNQSR